jgi:hypothetical protein
MALPRDRDETVVHLERLLALIDDLKRLRDPAARRALLESMAQEIRAAKAVLTPFPPHP